MEGEFDVVGFFGMFNMYEVFGYMELEIRRDIVCVEDC